jgi:hypothetical protein
MFFGFDYYPRIKTSDGTGVAWEPSIDNDETTNYVLVVDQGDYASSTGHSLSSIAELKYADKISGDVPLPPAPTDDGPRIPPPWWSPHPPLHYQPPRGVLFADRTPLQRPSSYG